MRIRVQCLRRRPLLPGWPHVEHEPYETHGVRLKGVVHSDSHVARTLMLGQCWCGMDETTLSKNGGEAASSQCDVECDGTDGEICGGFERMSTYYIECYYPDGFEMEAFTFTGCFIDSRTNRI